MLILSALLAVYAGMVGLALAMSKHYKQVWRDEPSAAAMRRLRVGGWLWLALALGFCVAACGGEAGIVTWCVLCFVAAVTLVFLLTYVARAAALLGAASAALALLLALASTLR